MSPATPDLLHLLETSIALASKTSVVNDRQLNALLYLLKLHPLSDEQSAELIRILAAPTYLP